MDDHQGEEELTPVPFYWPVEHYHEERPHQGIGNVLLLQRGEPECEGTDDEVPALSMADIQCQERLGGILKSYSRAA
ncbi:hypothetical protein GC197_06585 [bacterium]|nr:hypothetical protein [bacterium]